MSNSYVGDFPHLMSPYVQRDNSDNSNQFIAPSNQFPSTFTNKSYKLDEYSRKLRLYVLLTKLDNDLPLNEIDRSFLGSFEVCNLPEARTLAARLCAGETLIFKDKEVVKQLLAWVINELVCTTQSNDYDYMKYLDEAISNELIWHQTTDNSLIVVEK